jgi:hypothetical protein
MGNRATKLEKRSGSPLKKGFLFWALLVAACLFSPLNSPAQDNYEIQVYPSETVDAGRTMIELHSNMAVRGTTQKIEGVLPTQHALHETLEITHGFTSWFEVALYTFSSIQPGMDWQWVGNHIRPRVRVPESWHWPVGLGFSVEFGYQQRKFSTDTWTVELRPIIDKKWGPWYLSFNPTIGRSLKGENTGRGFEFSPNIKISYDLTPKIAGGVEYYGSLGPLSGFDPLQKQQHQLFPTIDLNLSPAWELNFGVGFGLTEATDRLIVKMILGRRF